MYAMCVPIFNILDAIVQCVLKKSLLEVTLLLLNVCYHIHLGVIAILQVMLKPRLFAMLCLMYAKGLF